MSELFRIKPLEWRPSFGARDEGRFAQTPIRNSYYQVYKTTEGGWAWFLSTDPTNAYHPCASLEEGKQLAEQHWQEYIKQALVPVETEQVSGRDVMGNEKAPERVWINSLPESGRVTAYVSPIREVGSGRSLSLAKYVRADLVPASAAPVVDEQPPRRLIGKLPASSFHRSRPRTNESRARRAL